MTLSEPLLEKPRIRLSEVANAFRLPGNPFIGPALAVLVIFHYGRVALSPIEATYDAATGKGRIVDIIARPVAGALYPAAVAVSLIAGIPAMGVASATGGREAMDNLRDEYNRGLNMAEEYIYGRMEMPKRELPQ